MNANTRIELQEFIKAIQKMAAANYTQLGDWQVRNIIEKGDQLIQQLDKDETIL